MAAAGPGAAGTARVSSGRELGCVPEVAAALGAVARQGFDFLCAPLFHPRHRREFRLLPAKERPGPQTRSDLLLAGRDWNTLIVGKVSPWIRPDSPLEAVRRNSEAALQQELDFAAYLGVPAVLLALRGPHCPNLARGLCAHLQGAPGVAWSDPAPFPAQPLMDNLESQTYEVFEKDPIKYSQYQQAIYKCLLDRVPEEEKETNVQVVLVLGAGRGPLVNAALRAARMAQRRIRVFAVEKNPNAVVTLESWQYEEWGSQVAVLWGVSIPCSYTSFLAPLSSSKLYNEVRGCRERDRHPEAQFETPYVVRLHNFHQLAAPQPCFTFRHPKPDPSEDNSRYRMLSFPVGVTTALHGFAGYFETTLYGDVTLSIRPETHSPGMFSWFPIFFPLKVRLGADILDLQWRCRQGRRWCCRSGAVRHRRRFGTSGP
uniref:Protein arginine N-methyltransferase 5 n=1 Tax=Chrysolophus pictus TaxID=9089 RepID=A0A8C3M085_CHRPC